MEENKNQEQNESNVAKRLRMLGENMDENIHSEEQEIKKGNFWHNLWYHHKWVLVFTLLILLTTTPIIVWCAQGVENNKRDVMIYYVGPAQASETGAHSALVDTFETICKDYDGENGVVARVESTLIYASNQLKDEDGNPFTTNEISKNKERLTNFQQLLMSGELTFILIDKSLYKEELEGQFAVLSDLGIDASEAMYDECALYLKKTEFGSYFNAFNALPDDTLIVINQKNINHKDEDHANHVDLLKSLIEYKKPE